VADALLVINLILVAIALAMELALLRNPGNRFARLVGVAGLFLMGVAYFDDAFLGAEGTPVLLIRPGFMLFIAYIIARNIYEHNSR
jgi:hypothetical protein